MAATVHLIKLCVGAETVGDLADWQARRIAERRATGQDDRPLHVTRMWPKRSDELAAGGSLYWVFKGLVLARQRIAALLPREGADGIRRCAIVFEPPIIRTVPQPRRPFQGWRYLDPREAPRDLTGDGVSDLPPELAARLTHIGVI